MPFGKIKSSEQALEIKNRLIKLTSIKDFQLTLLAICLSARVHGGKELPSEDVRGYETNEYTLTNNSKDPLLESLFSLIYGRNLALNSEEENLKRYLQNHLNHGLRLLDDLMGQADNDKYRFFAAVEQYAPSLMETDRLTPRLMLSLEIGQDISTGQTVIWNFNDSQKFPNQHVAIIGVPGSGKTQFLMSLLAILRDTSQGSIQMVVFDYKGDLASNKRFVERLGAVIYDPDKQPLPFNPFLLSDYSQATIEKFAASMSDTFKLACPQLGIVQQSRLRTGIIEVYQRRYNASPPCPDFQEVSTYIRENAEKPDVLTELLDRLAAYRLFASNRDMGNIGQPLYSRTCIIDLSHLQAYKELVAYIVLDGLYREMKTLGESSAEDGIREIRTLIVMDEAHQYLKERNPVLEKLLREGRSFGFGILLASQSIDDYRQQSDYTQFINNVFLFKLGRGSPSDLQQLIRVDNTLARRLLDQAYQLETGQCIWNASSAGVGKPSHTLLRARQFYLVYE